MPEITLLFRMISSHSVLVRLVILGIQRSNAHLLSLQTTYRITAADTANIKVLIKKAPSGFTPKVFTSSFSNALEMDESMC